jgi:transposase InsO family protein
VFGISRLLSSKGRPYDNAVTEAILKIVMTEFVKGNGLTLETLELEFMNYAKWVNNCRIYSSLGYMSQSNTEMIPFKKISKKVLSIKINLLFLLFGN